MRSTPRRTASVGPSGRAGGVVSGCGELGTMGLIDDPGGCCEACHSADRFAIDGAPSLGPWHTVLADGRDVLMCCAARKDLGGR